MRVNQPMWGQRQAQNRPPMQNAQNNNQRQVTQQNVNRPKDETEVMQLARKIKQEQGDKTAGYFLHAMRPYTAPGEITHIESRLSIHAEQDPAQTKKSQPGNMNMLSLLMRIMQSGSKPDPATLMRMMGNG